MSMSRGDYKVFHLLIAFTSDFVADLKFYKLPYIFMMMRRFITVDNVGDICLILA